MRDLINYMKQIFIIFNLQKKGGLKGESEEGGAGELSQPAKNHQKERRLFLLYFCFCGNDEINKVIKLYE